VAWIYPDRGKWLALVNTVMNLDTWPTNPFRKKETETCQTNTKLAGQMTIRPTSSVLQNNNQVLTSSGEVGGAHPKSIRIE
jgi:hypothetical protein